MERYLVKLEALHVALLGTVFAFVVILTLGLFVWLISLFTNVKLNDKGGKCEKVK
jgi:hypothetical protein